MKRWIKFAALVGLVVWTLTGCSKEAATTSQGETVPPSSLSTASKPDSSQSQVASAVEPGQSPSSLAASSSQQIIQAAWPNAGFYGKNIGSAGAVSLQISDVSDDGFEFLLDSKGITLSGKATKEKDYSASYKGTDCTLVFYFEKDRVTVNETQRYNPNVDLSGNYQLE